LKCDIYAHNTILKASMGYCFVLNRR